MLTVTASSNPRPIHHRPRRLLHCHLTLNHGRLTRKRSLSHPSPVAFLSDPSTASVVLLAPSVSVPGGSIPPSEDDEDAAPSTAHSAPFALKETSGESSDTDDEAAEDDDDSSDGISTLLSNAASKPVQPAAVAGRRGLPPSHHPRGKKAVVGALRRPDEPSLRQFKLSAHYYSPLKAPFPLAHGTVQPSTVKAHRRKHSAAPIIRDLCHIDASAVVDPLPSQVGLREAPVELVPSSFPSAPSSSAALGSYALLIAILRRSDGRDKLVKTVFYASNELRWLSRAILTKLTTSRRLLALLSPTSPSTPSVMLRRLAVLAIASCRRMDAVLGHLGDAMGSARQLLRFGRWVYDLQSLQEAWTEWTASRSMKATASTPSPSLIPLLELVNAFLSLLIDLFDDIEWLSEQHVVPSALTPFAGAASAALWLASVCIDIPLTFGVLWGMRGQRGDEWRAEVLSLVKYSGDGLYAASLLGAVAGWRMNEGLAQGGGLLSALVGLYKLSASQRLHRMVL